jgi:hypothetical protein
MVIQVTRRVCRLSRSQQVQCWDKLHLHYICHCMQCRNFIFLFGSLFFPLWFWGDTFRQGYVHGLNVRGLEKPYDKHIGGSLFLYLGFMLISLCFTSFYRIYNPLVPQTRFNPLSLQFSSIEASHHLLAGLYSSVLMVWLFVKCKYYKLKKPLWSHSNLLHDEYYIMVRSYRVPSQLQRYWI